MGEDLAAAAARENLSKIQAQAPELGWLLKQYQARFGVSAPLNEERAVRLAWAVAIVGRERVLALLDDRAAKGARPNSVAWFLPALEDMQAGREVKREFTSGQRVPVVVCFECGVGAGRHAAGCSLARQDADAEVVRAAMRELDADSVGRGLPA